MRSPMSWNFLPSTRLRRAPRYVLPAALEVLEVRSLLSASASIQWRMNPQIALDPKHGNQPDLPNTSAYVNPAGGYPMTLDASGSTGVRSSTKFSWTITDAQGNARHLTGKSTTLSLPQGSYKVNLEADGLSGSKKAVDASASVQVKDVLIVSIGDSYASGEGNPVVPGFSFFKSPQWAYSPDPVMNRENALAHRSTVAGPAQFALQLQQANPHEAVTFVSVADSGASIAKGLLGPMQSIGDASVQLPAEIAEVQRIIGTRHIDALTISIGGNDIGFVAQLTGLIENSAAGYPSLSTIQTQVGSALKTLPGQYAALGQAVKGLNPGQVLITDYPDLTRNQQGVVSSIPGLLGTTLISSGDARFASSQIFAPLDAAVSNAAKANHWTLVGGLSADFATHGYPSNVSWVSQLGDSFEIEGNADGTFHPNAAGHQDIARRLLASFGKA